MSVHDLILWGRSNKMPAPFGGGENDQRSVAQRGASAVVDVGREEPGSRIFPPNSPRPAGCSSSLPLLSNDNASRGLPAANRAFPRDAMARIERLSRSAMTSAPLEHGKWRLVFEARNPLFVEPLMGWTGSRDPLRQVELHFPTLASAIAYAQRQGLRYAVYHDAKSRHLGEQHARRRRAFSDATLGRLGLGLLRNEYGAAMAGADACPPPPGEPGSQHSAMDIVQDPELTVDDKRSILMNRAFDAYGHQQEHAGGVGWSELQMIDEALRALECGRDRSRRAA